MREGWWTPQVAQVGDRLVKVFSGKYVPPFKQNDSSQGGAVGQEPQEPENHSQVLECNRVCLAVFGQRFLLFSFFLNGHVYNSYPMHVSPLFRGNICLFSKFTSPQTEKSFAAEWIICRDAPTPDLDG